MSAIVDEGAPQRVNRLVVTAWAGERVEVTSVAFGAAPFARHYHEAYAVGLVRAGANRFRHGRALTEAGAGSLCLVNAGEVHDGGLAREPWTYRNVHLPPGAVATVAAELGVAPEFGTAHVTQPAVVAAVSDFLAVALQLPPHRAAAGDAHEAGDADAVTQTGMEAIGLLLSTHGTSRVRQSGRRAEDGLAVRAHALLADTPERNVTLAELGTALGASPFQVIRAVRALFGLTPHQLHLQLRTARARALVLAGRRISDAAVSCGFVDQAHLTREMRRRWGLPPAATRRALVRPEG